MEIVRDISKHKSYNTELYSYLSSLPEEILYNKEHGLRKPLGIYNVSSGLVFSCFREILNLIKAKEINYKDLSDKYTTLLHSLLSYIDDSYHMMKCLYPANSTKKRLVFADRWMEEVEPSILMQYKRSISDYREKLARIVNKIKHNHARFSHIKLATKVGSIFGYCIMGVDNDEVIYPDEEIHIPVGKMSTGFSYNNDIRFHLANFYMLSGKIVSSIDRIINKKYGNRILVNYIECSNNDSITTIIKDVSSMRHLYFPDEMNKPLSQIDYDQHAGILRIKHPASKSYANKLFVYNSWKAEYLTSCDGVTKSFKVPYLGDENG